MKERCANGPISYRDYIDTVLYSETCGYYRATREQVGRSKDRDFYTAESLGAVFFELVTTAAVDLLGEATARESTFIEIAAEPERTLLDSLEHSPFREARQDDLVKPSKQRGRSFYSQTSGSMPCPSTASFAKTNSGASAGSASSTANSQKSSSTH